MNTRAGTRGAGATSHDELTIREELLRALEGSNVAKMEQIEGADNEEANGPRGCRRVLCGYRRHARVHLHSNRERERESKAIYIYIDIDIYRKNKLTAAGYVRRMTERPPVQ